MKLWIEKGKLEPLKERENKRLNQMSVQSQKTPSDEYLDKCYKELSKEKIKEISDSEEYHWEFYKYDSYLTAADPKIKEAVENFIRGYLQYYDEITRNGSIDHVVFFNWKENELDVHICPKPLRQGEPEQCPPAAGLSSDPVPPKIPPPPPPGQ